MQQYRVISLLFLGYSLYGGDLGRVTPSGQKQVDYRLTALGMQPRSSDQQSPESPKISLKGPGRRTSNGSDDWFDGCKCGDYCDKEVEEINFRSLVVGSRTGKAVPPGCSLQDVFENELTSPLTSHDESSSTSFVPKIQKSKEATSLQSSFYLKACTVKIAGYPFDVTPEAFNAHQKRVSQQELVNTAIPAVAVVADGGSASLRNKRPREQSENSLAQIIAATAGQAVEQKVKKLKF